MIPPDRVWQLSIGAMTVSPVMTLNADCLDMIDAARDQSLDRDLPGRRPPRTGAERSRIVLDGRELIHFGTNDYLGLAVDPRILTAVNEAVNRYGWGSSAGPSAGGRGPLQAKLEQRLASFVNAEAALLFSSGSAANLDTIRELVNDDDAIFCDEQNHVSIADAARLSGATVYPYRHCDYAQLSSLLQRGRHYRRRLIASESLFGSDGNFAPLFELADLAERHNAMLLVDEAHAIGTHGDSGMGAAAVLGQRDCLVARVGTLSKALGGIGGFVAGRKSLVGSLAARAPGYLHSTSPPAAACAAALAAIEIIDDEPSRRTVLLNRAASVRSELQRQGWNVRTSASQIIPVWIGDAGGAENIAAALRDAGYYLPCVMPPHVPVGNSMLRLRINYGHEPWMIAGLLSSFEKLA